MLKRLGPFLLLISLAACTSSVESTPFFGAQISGGKSMQVTQLRTDPIAARPQPHSAAETTFVRGFLNTLQLQSFAESREYCGYIGVNARGGFVATPPVRGNEASCRLPNRPTNIQTLASYHTHGTYSPNYDNEVPSYEDLEGDIASHLDGYVSTPGGRIWYNIASERRATLLCGRSCINVDPNFRRDPDFPVGTQYTVAALRMRQE